MNTFVSKYVDVWHRFESNVFGKAVKNPIITVMAKVRVRDCGANDGFWIQTATPSVFSRPPRFGAPSDPANPGLHGRDTGRAAEGLCVVDRPGPTGPGRAVADGRGGIRVVAPGSGTRAGTGLPVPLRSRVAGPGASLS